MERNKLLKFIFIFLGIIAIATSCISDWFDGGSNTSTTGSSISDTILKVNKFVKDDMGTYYLWRSYIPNIDYTQQSDPFAYFDSLLYSVDIWSYITNDYDALISSLEGTELSFGYALAFGKYSNKNTYFAVIEYVNPNTPAENAGLKRGNIIVGYDGNDITADNYMNLFYKETITLNMGVLKTDGISRGDDVSLEGELLTVNPILISKIIEINGHKIGYLMYNQFVEDFDDSLDVAIQKLKDKGMTDLVLDLRYNPGGDASAAQHVCSAIGPLSAVESQKTIVNYEWNDLLTKYWKSNGYEEELSLPFDNTVSVKLALDRVFVLTGSGTASASELSIIGLNPYMNVVTIGDTTYGKYTGSAILQPVVYEKNQYVVDEMISNWAIQPIVLQYSNASGYTGFSDGLVPNYYIYDDLLSSTKLGDKSEPLLAKAIECIAGKSSASMQPRSFTPQLRFHIEQNVSSRFQKFKESLNMGTYVIGTTIQNDN